MRRDEHHEHIPQGSEPDTASRLVLLLHEARARGFKNALAFRRFCRKHGIAILSTSAKVHWVRPEEVDAVILHVHAAAEASRVRVTEACADAPSTPVDPVAAGVEALMLRARSR